MRNFLCRSFKFALVDILNHPLLVEFRNGGLGITRYKPT